MTIFLQDFYKYEFDAPYKIRSESYIFAYI